MTRQVFDIIPGSAVTDNQLAEAAALFRENYGVWGKQTNRPGQRVALSLSRMREQYLPSTASTAYIRAVVDGTLAAHAFVCRWRYKGLTVCWITQLVVDKQFRNLGLATNILTSLKCHTDHIYGIMSSHPAACLAAAKAFHRSIENIPLDYIATEADGILKSCPIPYIRDAKLYGTLFNDESEMVSGVDTGFFVDHDEPNAALEVIKAESPWPLGGLPEGHEFLLIIQQRRRSLRLFGNQVQP